MVQEIPPSGDKVFDPNLGEERDAFPGEIVSPGEEKTLNRLMREANEVFRNQFDPVIKTGQLNEDEINAIQKAANIKAELKRREYLDAIRSNPANILQSALKEFNPKQNKIISNSLISLDGNVKIAIDAIEFIKASYEIKGEAKDTLSYVKEAIGNRSVRGNLASFAKPKTLGREETGGISRKDQNIIFPVIKSLGLIPSEEIKSFDDLLTAVRSAKNQPSSGMPYIVPDEVGPIVKVRSKKPGLEGIEALLQYDNSPDLLGVQIIGASEVFTRIVDKGQYVPYNQQST